MPGELLLPHIKDSALDSSTGSWELAIDTIIGRGDEQKLILGNFDSDENTRFVKLQQRAMLEPQLQKRAYYLIDNVSLMLPTTALPTDTLLVETLYTFKNVQFEFNKADLKYETLQELNQLAGFLLSNNKSVHIIGHTDESGTVEYNQQLSERRARNVALYLVSWGIEEYRISFDGKGETEPVSKTSTPKENRRVEFMLKDN